MVQYCLIEHANHKSKNMMTADSKACIGNAPVLQFENANGRLYFSDCMALLASLDSESVDLIVADPPYNIRKAEWDNFSSMESYLRWSISWIAQASRVLKQSGSLYVCGYSEILADLRLPASKFFQKCRWLVWHYKNKANLGNDWGRSHESIIHFRKANFKKLNIDDVRIPYGAHTLKYPAHPQADTSAYAKGASQKHDNWIPNPKGAKPKDVFDIPTTCNGMGEKTPHPTQKPEELIRKLVMASSGKNDLVLDPFSGSGTTIVVAEQLGRRWIGGDICEKYNEWAIERIQNVRRMPVDAWIEYDRKNAERRESIR